MDTGRVSSCRRVASQAGQVGEFLDGGYAAVARAAEGDILRHWQDHLKADRRTTEIAGKLGVERKFLYRVFAGTEWVPR